MTTTDTRKYVAGTSGRVLLFHPGRTALSTHQGRVVWVENCKTPEAAEAFVTRQNEILAIAGRNMAARGESAVVMARHATWVYRLATEADTQIGK